MYGRIPHDLHPAADPSRTCRRGNTTPIWPLYNVVYVIPLLVITLIFTYTLGARKLSESEGRLLKLLSGIMMLGLGLVLLIAPDLNSPVPGSRPSCWGSPYSWPGSLRSGRIGGLPRGMASIRFQLGSFRFLERI